MVTGRFGTGARWKFAEDSGNATRFGRKRKKVAFSNLSNRNRLLDQFARIKVIY
jgi:hypothetical protein